MKNHCEEERESESKTISIEMMVFAKIGVVYLVVVLRNIAYATFIMLMLK